MKKIRSIKSPSPVKPTPRPLVSTGGNYCVWFLDEIKEGRNIYQTSCEKTYSEDQFTMEVYDMKHCIFCKKEVRLRIDGSF